jgi:hypothetical protein
MPYPPRSRRGPRCSVISLPTPRPPKPSGSENADGPGETPTYRDSLWSIYPEMTTDREDYVLTFLVRAS